MSAPTTVAASATGLLQDPTTLVGPVVPAFPLSQGNLESMMDYRRTTYGQISIISRADRPRGSHLCFITTHHEVPAATLSSIQTGMTRHIELNSALVYMNHSCDPTVEIEVYDPDADEHYTDGIAGEVRVARDKDLTAGKELTFFYPSTEWCASRPF
ncbi:MAG: hypothetical protein Q9179_006986 [Wetmoreana sp. 5 TL-2023]